MEASCKLLLVNDVIFSFRTFRGLGSDLSMAVSCFRMSQRALSTSLCTPLRWSSSSSTVPLSTVSVSVVLVTVEYALVLLKMFSYPKTLIIYPSTNINLLILKDILDVAPTTSLNDKYLILSCFFLNLGFPFASNKCRVLYKITDYYLYPLMFIFLLFCFASFVLLILLCK